MFSWLNKFKKNNKPQESFDLAPPQVNLENEQEAGYSFAINKNPDAAIVITLDNKSGEMLVITDIINTDDSKETANTIASCFIFTLQGYLASIMLQSIEDWSIEANSQEEAIFKQKFMTILKERLDKLLEEMDKKDQENLTNLKICVDAGDVFK